MYVAILKNIYRDMLGPFASLNDLKEYIEENPEEYTVWPQEYTLYKLEKIEDE